MGTPVDDVLVVAMARGEAATRMARTNEEGRFTLNRMTEGSWFLFAWHPSYIPAGLAELVASERGEKPPDAITLEVPATGDLPERVVRHAHCPVLVLKT